MELEVLSAASAVVNPASATPGSSASTKPRSPVGRPETFGEIVGRLSVEAVASAAPGASGRAKDKISAGPTDGAGSEGGGEANQTPGVAPGALFLAALVPVAPAETGSESSSVAFEAEPPAELMPACPGREPGESLVAASAQAQGQAPERTSAEPPARMAPIPADVVGLGAASLPRDDGSSTAETDPSSATRWIAANSGPTPAASVPFAPNAASGMPIQTPPALMNDRNQAIPVAPNGAGAVALEAEAVSVEVPTTQHPAVGSPELGAEVRGVAPQAAAGVLRALAHGTDPSRRAAVAELRRVLSAGAPVRAPVLVSAESAAADVARPEAPGPGVDLSRAGRPDSASRMTSAQFAETPRSGGAPLNSVVSSDAARVASPSSAIAFSDTEGGLPVHSEREPALGSPPPTASRERSSLEAAQAPSSQIGVSAQPSSTTANRPEALGTAPVPAGASPRTGPSPEAVPEQIVRAIRLQWRDGSGEARLQLQPEHLGRVTISLKVEGQALSAVVRAESVAAQVAIQQGHGDLRAALESQGLSLERLVVEVDPDGQRNRKQPPREISPRQRARRPREAEPLFEVTV